MRLILITPLLIFLSTMAMAQTSDTEDNASDKFEEGAWQIDLRPTPNADAYLQTLVIQEIEGNTFNGEFYGSTIKDGLVNRNWDKIYFAFSTSDQSNDYFHSGYLQDGVLYGISYCPNRKFAAPWQGKRK